MNHTDSNLKRGLWLVVGLLVVIVLIAGIVAAVSANTAGGSPFPLRVSNNHRYLVQRDGVTPYYPIADTAWMLYSSVPREDAELYLENRRSHGFNTISTTALPMGHIATVNVYGKRPFIDDDMAAPNDAYYEHVDWVINKAAEKGLMIMLNPAWLRDYADYLEATKARSFGRYMGDRYRDFDNIVWFIGGDIYEPTPDQLTFAREMAAGIREQDTRHLITYHPGGYRSSSLWFHEEDWLDFNSLQTYLPADAASYFLVLDDYNRSPAKPTWNMEPNYEGENGNTPYNVRLAEGWSALSGAFGVSYGSKVWRVGSMANWQKFLDLPGTEHFTNIAKAIQARAFEKLVPDQDHAMLTAGYGSENTFASAALASDGSFGMVYLPDARAITINMTQFNGSKTITWLDPTDNTMTTVGTYANSGSQDLPAQPNNSAGQSDWILIIE